MWEQLFTAEYGAREEGIKDLNLPVTLPPEKCLILHYELSVN